MLGESSKDKQSPPIAVLGDSRMSEGFSSSYFEQLAQNERLGSVNLAIPGSSLRVWYYMLKQIDPSRDSFRLLVIPLESYAGTSKSEDLEKRTADLAFVSPFALPISALDLMNTYNSPSAWCQIVAESLFKGYALRADLKEFVLAPSERYKAVRAHELYYRDAERSYKGNPDSLAKLFDRQANGLCTKSDLVILKRISESNDQTKYDGNRELRSRNFWLERIINCYSRSKTTVVIVKLPQSPGRARGGASDGQLSLRSMPNVSVIPSQAFANLEKAQYFFDDLHLNSEGRILFTKQLAGFILSALGSKSAALAQSNLTNLDSRCNVLVSNKKLVTK